VIPVNLRIDNRFLFDSDLNLLNCIASMKTKLVTLVCAGLLLGTSTQCMANEDSLEVFADVSVVRPGCFVATVAGSAIFVVSLPFALLSGSVKETAKTLVVKPARATFTRPVGDMDALTDF
jgi:hypothetical protein